MSLPDNMDRHTVDPVENKRRMLAGELYWAVTPDLMAERQRCRTACLAYNNAAETGTAPRRILVELWKNIIHDFTQLPPPAATEEEDVALLGDYPYIESPIRTDYGYNVKLGKGVFVNFNSTWLDTCTITVGDRTLIGPGCSFYAATHPLDPFLRNGLSGPEMGAPIVIGEDCWFGGNVTVLPGVTIGRGVTVGAGSVVTKDVPDFCVVAGNPARIIRKLDVKPPQAPAADKKEELK